MPDTCHKKCPLYATFLTLLIATALLAFLSHRLVTKQHFTFLVSPWQPNRAPDIVIIGVKKGGTRALLEILKLHPRIVSAKGEVHFYDKFYARGLDWYRARMPVSAPEKLVIEKTPAYFVTPLAPERMRGVNRDTLVVLVVRDPVDRLISDFTQLRGAKTPKEFDAFAFSADGQVRHSKPVTRGLYADHLRAWTRVFPPNQLHVVDGDQLIRRPVAEMAPLQHFLGIDQWIDEDTFYFNTSKGFYCWHSKGHNKCLGESKGRTHPNVSPDTLRRLRAFYKKPNIEFFNALRTINSTATFNWNDPNLF